MRTLLVDNYDSFTYNLFHYLAQTNGQEPEVVVNDDPRWRLDHVDAFDNVVLSPGPGHPERPGDFGICRELVVEGRLPTLGVCLGHQGLAALHGGRVQRAPMPCHGRISPVFHDHSDLFAGLPSPFDAVRYHSLAVDRLGPDLVGAAWTADGIVMGIRHRRLPQWGVQFHPESIGSAYSRRVLENFRDLTGRYGRPRRDTRPSPTIRSRMRAAEPRRLRVSTRALPTRWDDETAYATLFRGGTHAFWLDSSRTDRDLGRFSIMGNADGPLARVASADVATGVVTVRSGDTTTIVEESFVDWLDRDLAANRVEDPGLPCDFALGWVGYLGYELKALCGGELAHRSDLPDATMVFADRALVLDHETHTTYLLALVDDGAEASAQAWLDQTAARLADVAGQQADWAGPPPSLPELRLRHDRRAYLDLIEECQLEITAGETYEVCLTNMIEADGDVDPWRSYQFLRRTSPAPYAALLQFGTTHVLSTSPERFLRVERDGVVESRPIKGTRPRGATAAQDAALAENLSTSEKDRAENLMIVDLVRNDLGRCAQVGTVDAEDIFRVETHAMAHQMVSTVRARLRADCSTVRCVQAAFPPGSMTGAPKLRTMRIIDRLEDGPRGVYSGAIGYFSLTGAADLNVVIRTVVITPGRLRYGVGGAIIALSDPDEEVEETVVKAAPMVRLSGAPFPVPEHQKSLH